MDAVRKLVADKIRDLDLDMSEVSKRLGKNHAYIQQFIKRGIPRRLPELTRKQLADILSVGEADLGAPAEHPLAEAHDEGIREIDFYGGMGGGGYSDRQAVIAGDTVDSIKEETWRFPSTFVRQELRAPEQRLIVIETRGDSMFPTLASGDRVIVDTAHKVPSPDGIYALRDQYGGIIVKRLQSAKRRGDGALVNIISDNPSHRDEPANPDEIEIIGRVLYGLKKY